MLQQAAERIATLDEAFRATHEGFPVDVVEADVDAAFPGVELPNEAKRQYAEAVSGGLPFRFQLSG